MDGWTDTLIQAVDVLVTIVPKSMTSTKTDSGGNDQYKTRLDKWALGQYVLCPRKMELMDLHLNIS